MADDPEDVLELEDDAVLEDAESEQGEADQEAEDGEEDLIGFGDDEAAPASEDETSTIRQMRERLRESQRRIAELERVVPQKQAEELGPKPTLADNDFDEDRFEAALDDWKARKSRIEQAQQEAGERDTKSREEWAGRVQVYETGKSKLKVRDFDAAEDLVFAALSETHRALLMTAPDPAALVYALSRDAAKLDQLSKLDLMNAAKMVGKLEDKVKVTKRTLPNVDRPLSGNAAVSAGGNRELTRLEKEADKTGDRTKLIAYKKSLRDKAA